MATRRAGDRELVIRDDETFIAKHGDWQLFRIAKWSAADYGCYKLVLFRKAPKNTWHIETMGGIVRKRRDFKLLKDHYPDGVIEWLLSTLEFRVPHVEPKVSARGLFD